jgi:hypothetical protein
MFILGITIYSYIANMLTTSGLIFLHPLSCRKLESSLAV